ncbi:hypothetical protein QVD17_42278 [Tagetes erecta]|uniref:Uncharacterized protein n=1 Tax=Tagetes erecta TaxID=13708 RepID=A0AAD8NFD7_TARER|nr:hypothetical protein QVD17_42278 [Tagetes erecta]
MLLPPSSSSSSSKASFIVFIDARIVVYTSCRRLLLHLLRRRFLNDFITWSIYVPELKTMAKIRDSTKSKSNVDKQIKVVQQMGVNKRHIKGNEGLNFVKR